MILNLDRDAKKQWIGTITIDPGFTDVAIGAVEVKEASVKWSIADIPEAPVFDGKWDPEAKTLKGNATGGGGVLPFDLKRTGDAKIVMPAPNGPLSEELEGTWKGSLEVPNQTLRLELSLKPGPGGNAVASLTSIDQGSAALPVNGFVQNTDEVAFDVKMVGGSFKGKLDPEKTTISGDWTQRGQSLPLKFTKAGTEKKVEPAKP